MIRTTAGVPNRLFPRSTGIQKSQRTLRITNNPLDRHTTQLSIGDSFSPSRYSQRSTLSFSQTRHSLVCDLDPLSLSLSLLDRSEHQINPRTIKDLFYGSIGLSFCRLAFRIDPCLRTRNRHRSPFAHRRRRRRRQRHHKRRPRRPRIPQTVVTETLPFPRSLPLRQTKKGCRYHHHHHHHEMTTTTTAAATTTTTTTRRTGTSCADGG